MGSDSNMPSMPKADYNEALRYFQQAAQTQNQNYETGYNQYAAALQQAAQEMISGYNRSNLLMSPMSSVANQANNEILRLTGQQPFTNSLSVGQRMAQLGTKQFSQFANKLMEAEATTDPKKREALKNKLVAEYDKLVKTNPYEEQIKKHGSKFDYTSREFTKKLIGTDNVRAVLNASLGGRWDGVAGMLSENHPEALLKSYSSNLAAAAMGVAPRSLGSLTDSQLEQIMGNTNYGILHNVWVSPATAGVHSGWYSSRGEAGAKSPLTTKAKQLKTDWENKKKELEQQQKEYLKDRDVFSSLMSAWKGSYLPEPDRAYNQDEVNKVIESIPGYQFSQQQQAQALSRQQAARGMLRSGNTQLMQQEASQNLAQNTFMGYLNNLQNLVNQGSGATMGIAANQANQGGYLAGLTDAGGTAYMNTQRGIGQNWAQSYYNSGSTVYDANKFNTNMQFQDYMRMMGHQANMQAAAMNQAGSLGYLGLQNRMFDYNQQQNNSFGQGFLGGSI